MAKRTMKTTTLAKRPPALRHGFRSNTVVLPHESQAAYRKLRTAVREDLDPEGAVELALVDRIASTLWRLARAGRIEAGLLAFYRLYTRRRYHQDKASRSASRDSALEAYVRLVGEEDTNQDPAVEVHQRTADELREEAFSEEGPALEGQAFLADADFQNQLEKLAKYEKGLESGLFKTLHEFQRMRAKRTGETVSPPNVLDVGT